MTTDDDVIELIRDAGLDGPDAEVRPATVRRIGRQRRQRRVAVLAAAATVVAPAAALVAVHSSGPDRREPVAAGPSTSSRSSVGLPAFGNHVRITIARGCPASLDSATDVSNPDPGLAHRLVPAGRTPQSGVVCVFGGLNAKQVGALTRTIHLGRAAADRLATALNRASLKVPTGRHNCPMDDDQVSVIVLGFDAPTADVDLWYHSSGCQSVGNSHVTTYEIGDPSFYDGFVAAYAAVTR